jgi:hypothetical protein
MMANRINSIGVSRGRAGLLVLLVCAIAAPFAHAQANGGNSELVGQLTKALSITPAQASGGAGALFGFAKSRLAPADFTKVAASVPGIEGLIKSAPAGSKNSALGGVSGLGNSLGSLGGLASLASPFKKLGLPPEMIAKFVPMLTKYVESNGGASVAALLSGALK